MMQVCNKSPEIVPQNILIGIKLLHYDNAFGKNKKDTFCNFMTHAVSYFEL